MKADVRTTRQLPNTESQAKKTEKSFGAAQDLRRGLAKRKTHSHESASTRRISAEGSPMKRNSHGATARALRHEGSPPRARQNRTAPQRERFDPQDLRKGFTASRTNSHGATARALPHAQSPQGFAELKTISHGATARALPHAQSPQGFAELKTHGVTARALRHAGSTQMVHREHATDNLRRAQATFAWRHSESASTCTLSAEGAWSSRQIFARAGCMTRTISAKGPLASRVDACK